MSRWLGLLWQDEEVLICEEADEKRCIVRIFGAWIGSVYLGWYYVGAREVLVFS